MASAENEWNGGEANPAMIPIQSYYHCSCYLKLMVLGGGMIVEGYINKEVLEKGFGNRVIIYVYKNNAHPPDNEIRIRCKITIIGGRKDVSV